MYHLLPGNFIPLPAENTQFSYFYFKLERVFFCLTSLKKGGKNMLLLSKLQRTNMNQANWEILDD